MNKGKYNKQQSVSYENSDKIPPQALDAERVILGSIIIGDVETVETALELITEDSFYSTQNKKVFIAIEEILRESTELDIVILADKLRKKGWLEDVGTENYLSYLVDDISTTGNVTTHANIINEKAALRGIINMCSKAQALAYNAEEKTSGEIINGVEGYLEAIAFGSKRKEPVHIRDEVSSTLEYYEKKEPPRILSTGFKNLDTLLGGGMDLGEVVVIAGRPGMGKSAFSDAIAENVAKDHTVLIFSVEMTRRQIVERKIARVSGIHKTRIRTKNFYQADFENLNMSGAIIAEQDMIIQDDSSLNIFQMKAQIKREIRILRAKGKRLSLVVIDFIQDITASHKGQEDKQRIDEIMKTIAKIAKEEQLVIIPLSQFNRGPESRSGHKPSLGDLKESGAIEQNAHIVIGLYREGYYTKDNLNKSCEALGLKNREGAAGTAFFEFYGEKLLFVESQESMGEMEQF